MLEVRHLTVEYGAITALENVSLEVDEGEVVAVIGANGAGKTTLLSTVMGVVRPRSGDILLSGRRLTEIPTERIAREGIAYVPEGRRVHGSLTVEENLRLGMASRPADRGGTDFTYVYDRFPVLEHYSQAPARRLSGGEQQQLALARALVGAPKLMLLDEPSLGLAPKLVEQVFGILEQLANDGMTMLIVEQNAPQALALSDRTYIFQTGHVVSHGRSREVAGTMSSDIEDAYLGTRG